MTGFLQEILAYKQAEVAEQKSRLPRRELVAMVRDLPPARCFIKALEAHRPMALIAEVKRRSPSLGWIQAGANPALVAATYEEAGAAVVSILTDTRFFGGHLAHLSQVRLVTSVPLLRKDFLLEPYQIYQSRVAGADAVLLIVSALQPPLLRDLLALATELHLTALVEVHTEPELEIALECGATVIGINNRDLATFRTELATTVSLVPLLPPGKWVVSESGIRERRDVMGLQRAGVHAVLVGEALMRQDVQGVAVTIRNLMGQEADTDAG